MSTSLEPSKANTISIFSEKPEKYDSWSDALLIADESQILTHFRHKKVRSKCHPLLAFSIIMDFVFKLSYP